MSPIKQRPTALGARETAEQPTPVTPSPPAAESPPAADSPPADETPQASTPGATVEASPAAEGNSSARPRTSRLLVAVAVTALLLSMGAVTVIGLGIYHYRTMLAQPEKVEEDDDESSTKRAGLSTADEEDDDDEDEVAPPSFDGVVTDTTTSMRGNVEVVDVGTNAASLPDVILAQRIVADTKRQTLVLMLTGRRCDPCDGVDDALDDPLMQRALAGVRLVRVDLEVFKDELKRMDLPTTLYPAFFLLSDDLRPFDAVHGGEWDEDIAKNIAPVLGPFVRGELRERRHPDWAPTTSSISI